MKKRIIYLLAILMTSSLFSSCTKEGTTHYYVLCDFTETFESISSLEMYLHFYEYSYKNELVNYTKVRITSEDVAFKQTAVPGADKVVIGYSFEWNNDTFGSGYFAYVYRLDKGDTTPISIGDHSSVIDLNPIYLY